MNTVNAHGRPRNPTGTATSRRKAASALGCSALGLLTGAAAAQGTRVVRLAFLGGALPPPRPITTPRGPWLAFFRELSARGWDEGRNLELTARRPAGPDEVPRLAADVVASRPDVILSDTTGVILALRSLTSTIPIVMHLVGPPVELGLVASLARPGGNVTGSTDVIASMYPKYIELLREAIPGLSRLGMLWAPRHQGSSYAHAELQRAAIAAGLRFTSLPLHPPTPDIPGALAAALDARVQMLIVHPIFVMDGVFAWAREHKVPTMGDTRHGALLGYGADSIEQFETSARYVAMILDGRSPADLPVMQPRRFRLRVNLGTARAIGFELPRVFRLRVDEFVGE